MRRLGSRWRPVVSADIAEQARDLIVRAQAALSDDHVLGAQRQLLLLYDLLVPPLDAWALGRSADATSVTPGLLGLWGDLPDIDAERESIEELLVWHTGYCDLSVLPAVATQPVLVRPDAASTDDESAAQRRWLQDALVQAETPQTHWWRRFSRRAQGPLGDCAHISLQRGLTIVSERAPAARGGADPEGASPGGGDLDATTSLGTLQAGDRLTLRWTVVLPGRVLVLHAIGDAGAADLSLLLPGPDGVEEAVRRAHELVEVVGEVEPATSEQGGCEHSLILVWGPEMLPPGWGNEVLTRRCVPVGTRLWRYVYAVEPSSLPATASAPLGPSKLTPRTGP